MALNPNGYEKECPLCGTKFIGRTAAREFCSEDCRRQATSERQRIRDYNERTKRRYKKRMEVSTDGIMPPLKSMSPDELLRYGKFQVAQYVKHERKK